MGKLHQRKLGHRLILFPQPYIGHITPMLGLGHALHSRGFSISVIQTYFNSPDPSKFPKFKFHFIEDALSKSESPPSDPVEMLFHLNTSCSDPFRKCLLLILEQVTKDDEKVACLIADPMWSFAGNVADEFNLPKMALRTGGLLAFILYDSVTILREKGYFPLQEAQLEDEVSEVPPLKVKDLPPEEHHNLAAAFAKETKSYSQGIICNTFKEIEDTILDRVQQKFHPIPVFPIGPLHRYCISPESDLVTSDQTSIAWLNTQAPNSVLYVSFGTLAVISNEQLLEIAWGLAESKQPFLWVVRHASIHNSDRSDLFPEDFLETVKCSGRVISWAPQQQVLSHPAIGGFWTHCGWNSTIESICEGVPMICMPFFGDQKMNARHLTNVLRIGLQLEKGFERKEIEMTIKRLMVEKEGQEMRERLSALKNQANLCLMEGGSSYESLDQLIEHILSLCTDEHLNATHACDDRSEHQ